MYSEVYKCTKNMFTSVLQDLNCFLVSYANPNNSTNRFSVAGVHSSMSCKSTYIIVKRYELSIYAKICMSSCSDITLVLGGCFGVRCCIPELLKNQYSKGIKIDQNIFGRYYCESIIYLRHGLSVYRDPQHRIELIVWSEIKNMLCGNLAFF